MLKVLADSGPLAALYNKHDRDHSRALAFFRSHGEQLHVLVTWEVIRSEERRVGKECCR